MENFMKKLIFLVLLAAASLTYADTPNLKKEINDLDIELQNLNIKSSKDKYFVSIFLHTKDDKFYRIQGSMPGARGTQLNDNITKALLSKRKYQAKNGEIPEFGITCKELNYYFDKEKDLAIGMAKGCKKKS